MYLCKFSTQLINILLRMISVTILFIVHRHPPGTVGAKILCWLLLHAPLIMAAPPLLLAAALGLLAVLLSY